MVVWITFWFFQQAMVGMANLIGAFLTEASQAVGRHVSNHPLPVKGHLMEPESEVYVGVGYYTLGFVMYFVVSNGIPYGK